MSNNAVGTVLRIVMIFILLVLVWVIGIAFVYGLFCLLLGMTFSLKTLGGLFVALVMVRMFYPRNVFR